MYNVPSAPRLLSHGSPDGRSFLRKLAAIGLGASVVAALCLVLFLSPGSSAKGAGLSSIGPLAEGFASSSPSCTATWQFVPSPREREYNGLGDVDATGPDDVWAVGSYQDVSNPHPNTSLIQHWDGIQWTVMPNDLSGDLAGVEALAPDDVWVVGSFANGSDTETYAAHWNGTNWTHVPTPTREGLSALLDIDAIAPNDIWAVGYNHGFHASLALHWNGAYWALVPSSPISFGPDYKFLGVTAIASNDVWGVGYVEGTGSTDLYSAHWNGTAWTEVPMPDTGYYYPELYGVDAVSANDIWAVGIFSEDSGTTDKPLYMHWNGTNWTRVEGELVGTFDLLYGVEAISSNDIWAVGVEADCALCLFTNTFVEHWDGTSWSHVYSPNGAREVNGLGGVVAISTQDVWAVGSTSDYSTAERFSDALTIHYVCPPGPTPTGTPPTATATRTRTITPTPTACSLGTTNYAIETTTGTIISGTHDIGLHCDECKTTISLPFNFRLYDQSFSSAIVGSNGTIGFVANSNTYATTCFPSQEFNYAILPFWQELILDPTGGGCGGCGIFTSTSGTAPNRIFNIEWRAMDYFYTSAVNVEVRLYENAPNGRFDVIYGTVPVGTNQQVTVGVQKEMGLLYTQYVCENQSPVLSNGMMLTFTQPACTTATPQPPQSATPTSTRTNTPLLGGTNTPTHTNTPILSSSSTPTPTNTFLPGNTNTSTPTDTPIPTSTPTSVSDTSTPTHTPIAEATDSAVPTFVTSTATSTTPTQCAIEFTDVPSDSTFYANIRCLACRGIINGYTEECPGGAPCFKPGNLVTRGQLAKIVSNSAGFSEAAGSQQFEDVAPGSTFYDFVWRLANRGYINGYPCGGTGEPCGTPALPYFRPNANITRGQISKIVSNAAGLTQTPGAQQYQDVSPGSTFYDYIWRLSSLGIMQGYPCGGAGEPCGSPPLPYFRPGANATRGQASKIVANTFFPSCSTLR